MSDKTAPTSLARDPQKLGVTMKPVGGTSRDTVRYVIEIDGSFRAQGSRSDEPILADHGTFWLEINAEGVQVFPALHTPPPFNPFFEPETGRWSPEFHANRPPEVWFSEFVRDLLEPETRLREQHPRIVNAGAASWHTQHSSRSSSLSRPHLRPALGAGSVPNLELGKPKGKRLKLFGETKQRVQLFETSTGYQPESSQLAFDFHVPEAVAVSFRGSRTHRLVVGARAAERLFDHIGWGRETESNQIEQGGLLLGRVLEDRRFDRVEARVEDVSPARLADGSSAHLDFSTHAWKEMLDYVDHLETVAEPRLHVIGWYHTHPGQLSVFMSSTDRETQQRLFNQHWQFSMVLNPNRKEFRIYHGLNAEECQGAILQPSGQEPLAMPPSAGEILAGSSPSESYTQEMEAASHLRGRWARLRKRWFWIIAVAAAISAATGPILLQPGSLKSQRDSLLSHAAEAPSVMTPHWGGRLTHPNDWIELQGARLRVSASLDGPSAPLLVGDRLRVLLGPRQGWYQVERYSIGWIRAEDLAIVDRAAADNGGSLDSVSSSR